MAGQRVELLARARDLACGRAAVRLAGDRDPARDPEQALATVRQQLASTGATEFLCAQTTVAWSRPTLLPISLLNRLRRAGLEGLTAERQRRGPVPTGPRACRDVPYPEREITFLGNARNRWAVAFCECHGVRRVESAAASGLEMRGRRVMVARSCILEQLGWCIRQAGAPRLGEPLSLVDAEGRRLELRFACTSCHMEVYCGPAGER